MSPNHLLERERHRAERLALAVADLRYSLIDLETTQRQMAAAGVAPAFDIPADDAKTLESLFVYTERKLKRRLRPAGQFREQVSTAKRRARLLHGAL